MLDDSIHILLIEDEPAHAELIERAFGDRGNGARLTITHTLAEARAQLNELEPTIIVADWRLPDGDSSSLLTDPRCPYAAPMVIMTSYGSERMAVEAMRLGALDYIVKSPESMADMPHIVERAIRQLDTLREREGMQHALAEREAQFRLLAENSSDMISRHDLKGNLLYVSPSSRAVLGYDPAELIGQSVVLLIHPEDVETVMRLMIPSQELPSAPTLHYRARQKDGTYIWLETAARVIYDEHNQAIEVQASSRDITERKQSQVALQKAHEALQDAYDMTIEGWVLALDLRDRETEGHTQRVTSMALELAPKLGCSSEELVHIRRGALLHDMGKMGIPDEILQKPGPLTATEWEIMRRHPLYAYQMLSPISYLDRALIIPYYHHERWDGSGYPHGLAGPDIPLFARLFAVVDVWDALSSDRPYRKRLPPEEVITYLETEAGRLFDPDVVERFLPLVRGYKQDSGSQ
ncbi:MAG TPA: HD domain-containing phosphohydrolase [Anaerolineales bacterium]|nr:HD domain-containing phosphohydrolase [Anaerolineales bacterium]